MTAIRKALSILTVLAGLNYIIWRAAFSVNASALWLAIPFLAAEFFGILEMLLFQMTIWKPAVRIAPPAPEGTTSVDVFITTYNEDPELVERTARAACRIRWPGKRVHILDDGDRPALKKIAESLGCAYIARGDEWKGKPRHAKAGNVNNALLQTSGEFILILDADQIPAPSILERTLGYFSDPRCAFVQTPQYFYNTPPGDPFGTDAPLFYGPILQGKDGWNAAFFCGSNGVLRREALMRLGLTAYVKSVEISLSKGLAALEREVRRLRVEDPERRAARRSLLRALSLGRKELRRGAAPRDVSEDVMRALRDAAAALSRSDLAEVGDTLRWLSENGAPAAALAEEAVRNGGEKMAAAVADLSALGVSRSIAGALGFTRAEEAVPVQALETASITEDMATALRLHSMGYASVFHNEILAQGLAPEDLGTSLKQRLRWAQGTIQVFFRENPLTLKGLNLGQRLMYFATIYSYFGGFFSLMLVSAPIIWFFTGVAPVAAWSPDFFLRLMPFLLLNRLVFRLVSRGLSVKRSEQYNLALFPLWITAVLSVVLNRPISFVVTPKQREAGNYLPLVWPQIAAIALNLAGLAYATLAFLGGRGPYTAFGLFVNGFWALYNCVMLSSIVRAAVYQPPADWKPQPPEYSDKEER